MHQWKVQAQDPLCPLLLTQLQTKVPTYAFELLLTANDDGDDTLPSGCISVLACIHASRCIHVQLGLRASVSLIAAPETGRFASRMPPRLNPWTAGALETHLRNTTEVGPQMTAEDSVAPGASSWPRPGISTSTSDTSSPLVTNDPSIIINPNHLQAAGNGSSSGTAAASSSGELKVLGLSIPTLAGVASAAVVALGALLGAVYTGWKWYHKRTALKVGSPEVNCLCG